MNSSHQSFRSALSSRTIVSSHDINYGRGFKWKILLVLFFSNFILPGFILSYGVIANIRKESGHPTSELLIVPTVFCASWLLTEPRIKDVAECDKRINPKILAFVGIVFSFNGVIWNIYTDDIFLHTFVYGFLGGLGTSLVVSQLNHIIDDIFHLDIYRAHSVMLYGQALGQCFLPYVFMIAFYFYGHSLGYLIISGVVLQILPLSIFLKSTNIHNRKTSHNYTYKRAYSLFDDTYSITSNITDVPLADLSKKSWKSPSDENLLAANKEDETSFMEDEDFFTEFDQEYYEDDKLKTLHGVEILPQILEENEDVEDENEKARDENNSNVRKTYCMNHKQNYIIEANEITNAPATTDETIEISHQSHAKSNDIKLSSIFIENHRGGCGLCCSKFSVFNISDYIRENILYPLKLSLKTWQFYPVLLLTISTKCLYFYFSPFVALKSFSFHSKLEISNVALILSGYGFSWLSFLVVSSSIYNLKKSKYKIVSSFGAILSSLGLLAILEFEILELISLGTIFTGVGYGALSVSCNETSSDLIGLRKWTKIKGNLETMSTLLTIGVGIWLSFLLTTSKEVDRCFQTLSIMLILSGIFLIIIIFVEIVSKHRHNDHIWPHM